MITTRRLTNTSTWAGNTGRPDLQRSPPTGVVEVARGTRATIGDLFRLWGQPLGQRRIASFRSSKPIRAYVAGRPVRGDVSSLPLTPKAQIVVELGAFVPPHRSFLFPRLP